GNPSAGAPGAWWLLGLLQHTPLLSPACYQKEGTPCDALVLGPHLPRGDGTCRLCGLAARSRGWVCQGERLSTGDGFAGTWNGGNGTIPGDRNGGGLFQCQESFGCDLFLVDCDDCFIIPFPNGALGRFNFSTHFLAVESVESASASVYFQSLDPCVHGYVCVSPQPGGKEVRKKGEVRLKGEVRIKSFNSKFLKIFSQLVVDCGSV
uniref:CUB domain-containing protein n=1 Tax=Cyanistes caeruleus TaxID=156563 RepID=A0A8C0VFV9_CYACU